MSNSDRSRAEDSSNVTRRSFLGGLSVSSSTLLFGSGSTFDSRFGTYLNAAGDTQRLKRPFDSRIRWRNAGRLKENFEDLSEWDVVSGSMTVDSSTSSIGTQAAKLSTTGKQVRIETSISPTDFNSYDVSIAAKLTESNADVEVRLCDDDGDCVVYRSLLQATDGGPVKYGGFRRALRR